MTSIEISILNRGYLVSHITPTDQAQYAIESETALIRTLQTLLSIYIPTGIDLLQPATEPAHTRPEAASHRTALPATRSVLSSSRVLNNPTMGGIHHNE